MRKQILDIKIDMNGPSVELNAENGAVVMIPFKGYVVESCIFTGIVEPCGVDTQVVNAAQVRHMSARYMLTGKDAEGNDCHIYIENNGWFDERGGRKPPEPGTPMFHTVPTFITDSPVLAPYLHQTGRFEGEGWGKEDGLHILFYEIG